MGQINWRWNCFQLSSIYPVASLEFRYVALGVVWCHSVLSSPPASLSGWLLWLPWQSSVSCFWLVQSKMTSILTNTNYKETLVAFLINLYS